MFKRLISFHHQLNIWAILRTFILYCFLIITIIWWQHRDMLATGSYLKNTEIHLIKIDGTAFHYQLNNHQQDTLVYFFAPWCQICHASIDNLEALKASYSGQVNLIIIALDWQSIEEIDEFLAKHQLTSPVLLGTRQLADEFQVTAFPSYYLIAKDGEVLARNKGYSSELGMKLSVFLNR